MLEFFGNFGIEADRGNRRAIHDGFKDQAVGIAAERKRAGGHFVENYAKGKKIGAGVEVLAANLFRGHVSDSAERSARAGELAGVGAERVHGVGVAAGAQGTGNFGETEIEDFGVAALGDEDVGGLDVAMNDVFGVSGVEAIGNFDGVGEKAIDVHGTTGHSVFEGRRRRGTPWRCSGCLRARRFRRWCRCWDG